MADREKQIEEQVNIWVLKKIIRKELSDYFCPKDCALNRQCEACAELQGISQRVAEVIHNAGYRKMDEITLKLDLGDRSAEEIQQIAEAFANEPTTAILVPSNESEIRKQVAKDILQEFWHIERGQTELDNVCIRIADKFGLLKELQACYCRNREIQRWFAKIRYACTARKGTKASAKSDRRISFGDCGGNRNKVHERKIAIIGATKRRIGKQNFGRKSAANTAA